MDADRDQLACRRHPESRPGRPVVPPVPPRPLLLEVGQLLGVNARHVEADGRSGLWIFDDLGWTLGSASGESEERVSEDEAGV